MPSTVYDRMKAGGYVMGPNHPMARQMKADGRDKPMEDGKPPNLRDSGPDPAAMRCVGCAHFDDGNCMKHNNYPVQQSDVCDSYEEPGEEMDMDEAEEGEY